MGVRLLILFWLFLALASPIAHADDFELDAYVARVQAEFRIPGVGIGVIKDGEVIITKGYGVTDLEDPRPVDEQTIFKIASNTKAFTATALAMLVDEEKLSWTDPVSNYLTEFKLYDDYASQAFTPIDLLTHRSGLGLGAGDLMLWPEPTKFSRDELIHNLRYLKPAYGFRARYAYDNTLYIVAGELVAAISGMPWEQFIQKQIFEPLQMSRCYAGGINTKTVKNVTAPHVLVADELRVDTPNRIRPDTTLMAAAGGIKCSLKDLLTWVRVQLKRGKQTNGEQLYSTVQAEKMWTAFTPMTVYEADRERDKTNFRAYGLGWRLKDYQGLWQVSHTGTLSGTMSEITLFPTQNTGIIVLINSSSGYARAALTRGIAQEILDLPRRDWVAFYLEHQAEQIAIKEAVATNNHQLQLPKELSLSNRQKLDERLGTYRDPWFGEITLFENNGRIEFKADKVPRLRGEVFAYDQNTWWVKWFDRSFRADAWLSFEQSDEQADAQNILRMNRILEKSDWSFNFQDLLFTKVKNSPR